MVEVLVILTVLGSGWFFFYAPKKNKTAEKENTDVKYVYSLKEIELIDLINYHITSLGLPKLKINNYVSSKCLQHNSEMILAGEATHNGFESRSQDIIDNLDVKYVGENIAYGYASASSIFKAWLGSPNHKKNLEDSKWLQMGLSITDKHVTNIFIC